MEISISQYFKSKITSVNLGTIICQVTNTEKNEKLWELIHQKIQLLKNTLTIENIKKNPNIEATRHAYKTFGKDPNRYRPSAEALQRRIIRGFDLYQINTVVDSINLVSLKSGFSIGAFDADVVKWPVELDVGRKNEPYQGIGKGTLNIEGLPVLRDVLGGIGTPTSDEMRTRIQLHTKTLYVNINSYTGKEDLEEVMDYTTDVLKKHAQASIINRFIVS